MTNKKAIILTFFLKLLRSWWLLFRGSNAFSDSSKRGGKLKYNKVKGKEGKRERKESSGKTHTHRNTCKWRT